MTTIEPIKTLKRPFRPRARLLQLLGDQLIGSARLAVFELVKNAYDADATEVIVKLEGLGSPSPFITVEDNGEGMTLDTIENIWLVPADDHREKQRKALTRTQLQRLPLGEKGLGRFAVHKLGDQIELITRHKNSDEVVVKIDWRMLIAKPFLSDALVSIQLRKPVVFTKNRTGTSVRIDSLRQKEWTRGEVRRLQRQITSISSPFEEPASFRTLLIVPGFEHWVEDIPDVDEILRRAFWKFSFRYEDGKLDWSYRFRKIPKLKLDGRNEGEKGAPLLIDQRRGEIPTDGSVRELNSSRRKKIVADEEYQRGIGPISGEFYVFDRDREVMQLVPETKLTADFLDENGGIRVYRDGIRVYNYGEPGDDWLGLDLRRVNTPTRNISRNIIVGAVHLTLQHSQGLVEKTNREGFVENEACERLKQIVLGILAKLETERKIDKANIRAVTGEGQDPEVQKIQKPLEELRGALSKAGILPRFEPYLEKIEHDYSEMRETLLHAGLSGLNLAVVFHEIERGIRVLHHAIKKHDDPGSVERQASDLMRLMDGFATLLRKDSRSQHSMQLLARQARTFNMLRFQHHRISLECPLLNSAKGDFSASFSFSLVLGAVNNILDNSIYWLRVRWPKDPPKDKPSPRKIYIGTSNDLEAGPALIIADNGPGFKDPPDRLTRPFFTRKPAGMGLGLYYVNLVMELNGGQVLFPEPGEVDVPEEFDGAVIALVFGKK